MLDEANRHKIHLELRKEFGKDRSITKIAEMSRFGLIEMTRQRVRPSVIHTINNKCKICNGTGLVPTLNTTVSRIERWIQRYRAGHGDRRIWIHVAPDVYNYIVKGKFNRRMKLMWKYWMKISIAKNEKLQNGEYEVFDRKNKAMINEKTS
jgi:ribonuclease G